VSNRFGRRLQIAAAGLTFVGYAGLSHYCNSTGSPNLGAALALTPMTVLALVLCWRSTPPLAAAFATGAIGATLYYSWPLFAGHYPLLYLMEQSTVYVLGLTFLGTLRGGRTALCTRLADRVHGPLTAGEVLYTRRVTAVWGSFFFGVAALSVSLFVLASLRVWSFYINFCVPPLIIVMFAVEYAVRRRVLPQVKRVGVVATMRVYFTSPKVS
jgi:uncharacterized membrane protein